MDIFCCPVPPSRQELHLTDGVPYNYNCQSLLPAALKTIIKRLGLSSEAVIEAAKPASIQAVLLAWYFLWKRAQPWKASCSPVLQFWWGSQGLQLGRDLWCQFVQWRPYGRQWWNSLRVQGGGGRTIDRYLIYVSTKEPMQECRSPWTAPFTKPILELAKLSALIHQVRLLNFLSKSSAIWSTSICVPVHDKFWFSFLLN